MAFIDIGDQFIALAVGRTQSADGARHFGLVVDDKEAVRAAMRQAGVLVAPYGSLDFDDPWGNHVQVVDYREIQFTKETGVLRGMRLDGLEKSASAQQELRDRGSRRLTDLGGRPAGGGAAEKICRFRVDFVRACSTLG